MKGACEPNFYERVYAITKRIPQGRVSAYSAIAAALGAPRAARAVGYALMHLPFERTKDVPWHRVIAKKGTISLGGAFERPAEQKRLLIREGVTFDAEGRIDQTFFWSPV